MTAGRPPVAAAEWEALQAGIMAARRLPCQVDPVRWWSTSPPDVATAADGCLDCPVMVACAGYAVAAREPDGVWGGLTVAERAAARLAAA